MLPTRHVHITFPTTRPAGKRSKYVEVPDREYLRLLRGLEKWQATVPKPSTVGRLPQSSVTIHVSVKADSVGGHMRQQRFAPASQGLWSCIACVRVIHLEWLDEIAHKTPLSDRSCGDMLFFGWLRMLWGLLR